MTDADVMTPDTGSQSAAQPDADENRPGKPDLLTVDDAKALPTQKVLDIFAEHMSPGQLHFMKLLGFHKVIVESAEGMRYTDRDGRQILDFFGGFGSLAYGHNHPRILAARKKFQDEKRHEIAMAFPSQYATALAHNLAAIAPGDLDMVLLCSTGSEAMEAAIKVAEQAQGPGRSKIIYAENAFHGKTKGALAVTDSELYRSKFRLQDGTTRVPFGDIAAIEAAITADPEIGIVVLETIQGGGGIVQADADFWKALRELCDRHEVLWIADEVQCGIGRSGRFFAFEHYGVVPDVTALAKSMGGGKAAMGAMISSRDVFMRAYGKPKNAMIHGPSTFGGIGEACVTAIEALNLLYDEGLIENSARQGEYLLGRLQQLKDKYPKLIKDVRGRGLMVGLEFHDISNTLPMGVRQAVSLLDDRLKGSLCGFVGALLLARHGVLVAFTEYNRNVIRLEPPLIVTKEDIDELIEALDAVFSGGVTGIVTGYIKLQAAGQTALQWVLTGSS